MRIYKNSIYPFSNRTKKFNVVKCLSVLDKNGISNPKWFGLIDALEFPEHMFYLVEVDGKMYTIENYNLVYAYSGKAIRWRIDTVSTYM